jgi:hypothetical protein
VNLKPPLKLFLQEQLFGTIITYGYDTPWAVGQIRAVDANRLCSMIKVCELLAEVQSWPDLVSVARDDERWQAALVSRGLTQSGLEQYSSGLWVIETQDRIKQEISLPVFDKEGFLTWRW